jgi:hypothetical protein
LLRLYKLATEYALLDVEGVWEQGAEDNIYNKEGDNKRSLEKIAQ